jgi:tRNA(Ile)-lysidine synthase
VYDMTRVLQDEERYMHRQAREAAKEVTEYRADRQVIVNLEKFRHLDNPLQRRVILILLNYLPAGWGAWQNIHVDDVLQLVRGEGGFKRLTLPYQTDVKRLYDRLHIEQQDGNRQDAGRRSAVDSGERTEEDLVQQVQNVCIIWEAGEYVWLQKKICVQVWEDKQDVDRICRELETGDNTAYFDAHALTWPLIVNTRQPGDRLQLFGMTGHKKVKGLFIDAKIPLPERAGWPLVREEEHILWIPQVARSNKAKITPHTKAIVSIEIKRL